MSIRIAPTLPADYPTLTAWVTAVLHADFAKPRPPRPQLAYAEYGHQPFRQNEETLAAFRAWCDGVPNGAAVLAACEGLTLGRAVVEDLLQWLSTRAIDETLVPWALAHDPDTLRGRRDFDWQRFRAPVLAALPTEVARAFADQVALSPIEPDGSTVALKILLDQGPVPDWVKAVLLPFVLHPEQWGPQGADAEAYCNAHGTTWYPKNVHEKLQRDLLRQLLRMPGWTDEELTASFAAVRTSSNGVAGAGESPTLLAILEHPAWSPDARLACAAYHANRPNTARLTALSECAAIRHDPAVRAQLRRWTHIRTRMIHDYTGDLFCVAFATLVASEPVFAMRLVREDLHLLPELTRADLEPFFASRQPQHIREQAMALVSELRIPRASRARPTR